MNSVTVPVLLMFLALPLRLYLLTLVVVIRLNASIRPTFTVQHRHHYLE